MKTASMAASLLIPLCLCILLLRGASAVSDQQEAGRRDSCDRIDRRIRALEPTRRVTPRPATPSSTTTATASSPAPASRRAITIQRNGLLLPSYSNSPRLAYIVHGRASSASSSPAAPRRTRRPRRRRRRSRRTTSAAAVAAVVMRRDGDRARERRRRKRRPAAAASSSPSATSTRGSPPSARRRRGHPRRRAVLGPQRRRLPARRHLRSRRQQQRQPARPNLQAFRLAGGQARSEGRQRYGEGESSESETERGGEESYNILSGFDTELLAESMRVSPDIARKLQGRSDKRGNIVRVRRGGLRMLRPATSVTDEEMMRGANAPPPPGTDRRGRLLDEAPRERRRPDEGRPLHPQWRPHHRPQQPEAPRPQLIKMSVNRGVMRRNAILAPHWNINAHAAVYATRARPRLQVVSSEGRRVFDGELRRGQMVVVPQSFAWRGARRRGVRVGVVPDERRRHERAGGWQVVGAARMPADVLDNAFGVSREEARMVKFGRGQELAIFSPKSGAAARRRRSPGHRDDGVLAAPA
uniref:Early embryogenesis protein n=1 Tax=Oryza sativa TaxID=4530 RepID=Q9ZRH9_ORYSA|nr:early embryogenesis protein [Oryza sativa Japonica Group]